MILRRLMTPELVPEQIGTHNAEVVAVLLTAGTINGEILHLVTRTRDSRDVFFFSLITVKMSRLVTDNAGRDLRNSREIRSVEVYVRLTPINYCLGGWQSR